MMFLSCMNGANSTEQGFGADPDQEIENVCVDAGHHVMEAMLVRHAGRGPTMKSSHHSGADGTPSKSAPAGYSVAVWRKVARSTRFELVGSAFRSQGMRHARLMR